MPRILESPNMTTDRFRKHADSARRRRDHRVMRGQALRRSGCHGLLAFPKQDASRAQFLHEAAILLAVSSPSWRRGGGGGGLSRPRTNRAIASYTLDSEDISAGPAAAAATRKGASVVVKFANHSGETQSRLTDGRNRFHPYTHHHHQLGSAPRRPSDGHASSMLPTAQRPRERSDRSFATAGNETIATFSPQHVHSTRSLRQRFAHGYLTSISSMSGVARNLIKLATHHQARFTWHQVMSRAVKVESKWLIIHQTCLLDCQECPAQAQCPKPIPKTPGN